MPTDTLVGMVEFEPKSLYIKCNAFSAFLVTSERNSQNIPALISRLSVLKLLAELITSFVPWRFRSSETL